MVWQQDLAIYSVSIKQITTNEISVKNKIKYFGGKEMTQQEIQEKTRSHKRIISRDNNFNRRFSHIQKQKGNPRIN